MTDLFMILGTLALLLICLFLYFPFARKKGILAGVNTRSSHKSPTVTAAGFIFPLSLLVYYIYSLAIGGSPSLWLLVGMLLLAAVSFADDLGEVWFVYRLLAQLFGVSLMMTQVVLELGFFPPDNAAYVVIFVVLIGFGIFTINLFNFMDGINGMLGLLTLSVLIPLALTEFYVQCFTDPGLLLYLLLPTLVFLFFNCRRRPVFFCGDVGSITVGFVLTYLVVKLLMQTGDLTYLLFFAVIYIEAGITVLQRLLAGQNIFKPHRIHLFQLLSNERGFPHAAVSAVYASIQLLIGLLVVGLNYFEVEAHIRNIICWGLFTVLCIVYLFVKRKLLGGHLLDIPAKFVKEC